MIENPLPDALAAVILTFDPPELVKVWVSDLLFPTLTLPKLIEDGLPLNAPSATPVALSGIVSVGFEPSEVIATLPDVVPLAVGANLTVKLVLCPALKVTGRLMPLRLNPEPEAVAPVIFRLEPPELVRVCVTL